MKTRLLSSVVSLVAFCMIIAGCNKSDSGSGGPVDGTWKGTGTITGQSGTHPTTLSLSQDGSTITGTWDEQDVTGSFDGTTLNLTLKPFTDSGVNFTGTLTATYDGTYLNSFHVSMTGTYGSSTVTVTANAARLTKSDDFADMQGGLLQSMCDGAAASVK
jgi:hypothetical protein